VLQSDATIDEIAHHFVTARKSARALVDYPGNPPHDLSTAYAVQDEAIALYGGTICGWKVGRIQPPLAAELGTTRLFGPAWTHAERSKPNICTELEPRPNPAKRAFRWKRPQP
jgi:2-keto-4-pentenoate hydratase